MPFRPSPNLFLPSIFLLALIILFLLGLGIIPSSGLGSAFDSAAKPFWIVEDSALGGFNWIVIAVSSKETLSRENLGLQDTILELEAKDAGVIGLENENAALRSAFMRPEAEPEVAAAIIVWPPISPDDTIVVDAGTQNGVAVGDRVVKDSVALGSVISVSAKVATVTLYSASGNQFEALVGTSSASVEAVGKGGGMMEAEVPKGFPIEVGDSVILPSVSPFIYGTVGSVSSSAQDAFSQVLFRSPINIFELRIVEIIE